MKHVFLRNLMMLSLSAFVQAAAASEGAQAGPRDPLNSPRLLGAARAAILRTVSYPSFSGVPPYGDETLVYVAERNELCLFFTGITKEGTYFVADKDRRLVSATKRESFRVHPDCFEEAIKDKYAGSFNDYLQLIGREKVECEKSGAIMRVIKISDW